MKENELRRALDVSVTGCRPSGCWKNRMVRQIVKGEEMKKRTKLSFGIVIAAALVLVSALALAVGVLVHEYYAKVAEMERSGALDRWNLEDKTAFVNAMKECNLEVDEDLYRILSDSSLAEEEREAAADRIIDNTYGELIRESLGYYYTEPEDSLGRAPDPVIVFQERYFAEHPEGIETTEDLMAYTDALGYYLRDEIYGKYPEDGTDGDDGLTETAVIDAAYAIDVLKSDMTEMYGWDPEAVEGMTPETEWDAEYRMWTVTGEVSAESMEKVTDLRKGLAPSLSGGTIEKTETGYRAGVLVDEKGRRWAENLDKEEFRQWIQETGEYHEPEITFSSGDALRAAERAVTEKYRLTEKELDAFFAEIDLDASSEDGEIYYRIDFHTHYWIGREMMYGAAVNAITGETEAAVSYREEDLSPEWKLVEYAAQKENREGWYARWSMESKRGLTERIRACELLPEHAFWRNPDPDEEETDAFVAEVFGAEGHLSAVNTAVMLHALKGWPESWDMETRLLADKIQIASADTLAQQKESGREIGEESAVRIIRDAVCTAWQMPEGSLDAWIPAAQLVQGSDTGLIFYRVFLTRPDEEVGQDTFGGKDNMNYRVTLDGRILDSSIQNGWYSPEEDAERWKK